MTERLTQLLRDEADALTVPSPAVHDVLARGRGLRRRRRTTYGVVAGAAVLVLSGGALVAVTRGSGSDGQASDPTGDPSRATRTQDMGAVFTIGTTLYYDDGQRSVQVQDKAVESMYYTSAGVLVRTGNNNFSDGGGPQRFELVTPAGVVRKISVVTEEDVPGVDANQQYLAYSEKVDGVYDVVVHDLVSDEEVARVPMPGISFTGGWSAPPVALSGDQVYVDTDDVATVVDWRTGTVRTTVTIPPGYPAVNGGHSAAGDGSAATVVDVATGETLISADGVRRGLLHPLARWPLRQSERADRRGQELRGLHGGDR